MKNIIITICGVLAAITLPACVDRSAMTGGSNKGAESHLIITQPSSKEVVAPIIDTLRQTFTRAAEVTSGARVPNPQISILLGDGKIVAVSAPSAKGGLFGDTSPKARQQRLDGHLKALEAKLSSGCNGKAVPAEVVKEAPKTTFKDSAFSVWASGGGGNPWVSKESAPAAFLEDPTLFAEALISTDAKGSNFLIVSDSTGVNKIALFQHGESTVSASAPIASGEKDNGRDANPGLRATDIPRAGDTFIVEMKNYSSGLSASQPQDSTQSRRSSVTLPQGVERVGDAIQFATKSAKLSKESLASIERLAQLLKKRSDVGRLRLFLVAQADYRDDEEQNERLSQKRAAAVQAALLGEGIAVEQIIAIGESLSPDDTAKTNLAEHRTVRFWILPERVAALSTSSTKLAGQTR